MSFLTKHFVFPNVRMSFQMSFQVSFQPYFYGKLTNSLLAKTGKRLTNYSKIVCKPFKSF